MRVTRRRLFVAAAAALAAAATAAVPGAAARLSGHGRQLFASPTGSGRACTGDHPCALTDAIAVATAGATIHVRPGRYRGGYVIDKRLRVLGQGRVVIDASSSADGTGIHIVGPGGSGSVIQGLTIEKARFEGILVGTSPGDAHPTPAPVGGVVIRNDNVLSNDAGRGKPGATGECAAAPPVPADCGGGIHLVWVTGATVENNVVAYNADGILLTDEFGPTSKNTIRNNRIVSNIYECGIVLAGHSPKALDPATGGLTGQAGVFDNLVEKNLVRDNGVALSGAGVLLGGGAPGSAVYDNVVRSNTIDSNGHSGVTIHQHVVGDLNGNQILDNTIGRNNMLGDDDFAAAVDMQTTGILVASGAPPGGLPPQLIPAPITGTVISGNEISDDAVGIWTLNAAGDYTQNTFASNVTTTISMH